MVLEKKKFVRVLNSLPQDQMLDWSKMKTLADDKINANENLEFGLGRVENIMGNGENTSHQHFFFSHNVFKRLLSQGC